MEHIWQDVIVFVCAFLGAFVGSINAIRDK